MKRIFAICFALLMLGALCACAEAAPESQKTYDLPAIRDKMIADLAIEDPLMLATERLSELYGIADEDVQEAACFITLGSVFSDEIVMIRATDASAAARVREKLDAHLKDVTNQAQNYDAESLALFQKCKVGQDGNYVNLFISPRYSEMQEIFTAAGK